MNETQKLNPQAERIYQILLDGEWHCPISWNYADGHCKRISDINSYLKDKGKKVIGEVCKCGRHTSKVLKRKIVPLSYETTPSVANLTPQTYTTVHHKTFCCTSYWNGKPHDPKCYIPKQVRQTAQPLF